MDDEDLLNVIFRLGIVVAVLLIALVISIIADSKPQNNQYNCCPYCGAKMEEQQ